MLSAVTLRPMDPWLLAIGIVTGLATAVGGAAVLRFRSRLELLMGFSAGAVLGVALFDLLPEAFELAGPVHGPLALTSAAAVGFAGYFLLDRANIAFGGGSGARRGDLGAASLTAHSLMDGVGIGLAFQVSYAAGLIVAMAVLAHDFVDGANTVTLSLSGGGSTARARRWLAADALAPLAGIALSSLLVVPRATLALLLALFAGFFLYIGTGELPGRGDTIQPRLPAVAAAALGLGFIYLVVRLAAG